MERDRENEHHVCPCCLLPRSFYFSFSYVVFLRKFRTDCTREEGFSLAGKQGSETNLLFYQ